MEVDNPFQAAQTIDPEVRAYVYSLVNAVSSSIAESLSTLKLTPSAAGRSRLRRERTLRSWR